MANKYIKKHHNVSVLKRLKIVKNALISIIRRVKIFIFEATQIETIMKKNLSYLVMAILGGVIAIGGYTNLVEKPIVEKREEQPLQTFQNKFQTRI